VEPRSGGAQASCRRSGCLAVTGPKLGGLAHFKWSVAVTRPSGFSHTSCLLIEGEAQRELVVRCRSSREGAAAQSKQLGAFPRVTSVKEEFRDTTRESERQRGNEACALPIMEATHTSHWTKAHI
jgi:hypothetical protein